MLNSTITSPGARRKKTPSAARGTDEKLGQNKCAGLRVAALRHALKEALGKDVREGKWAANGARIGDGARRIGGRREGRHKGG